jgi:hypothetical protein
MTELKKLFKGKNCLWDKDFRNQFTAFCQKALGVSVSDLGGQNIMAGIMDVITRVVGLDVELE